MSKARAKPTKREAYKINAPECHYAAEMIMSAFVWGDHPWGRDFWTEVHNELERLGASKDD
jgi:hypothetical protein